MLAHQGRESGVCPAARFSVRMRTRAAAVLVMAVATSALLATNATSRAVDDPAAKAETKSTKPQVVPAATEMVIAAKVNGQAVTQQEVEREVLRALAGQQVPPAVRQLMVAQALQQLVDRRLILAHFEREEQAANVQEIDVAMTRFTVKLTKRKLTLAAYLQQSGIDEAALRAELAWQISWRKYLERYFTEENLQKYFALRHRDFDGTELQIAHILFKVDADQPEAGRKAALERAGKVRDEITSLKLTFAQAAAKYSAAPTAKQGGDIGLISRRDPMPESFSRAAYAVKKGETSEPVATELGVHLITVLDIKPGPKTWQQVRPELELSLAQYLFEWLAGRERPAAQIEFTGKSAYFDPQTGAVVAPKD